LSVQGAVKKIHRTGRYLFDEDGQRFYIKGLAYQEPGTIPADQQGFPEPTDYVDPLADITACERDIKNFVKLGINTIRVYNVNPQADHKACMNALEDDGIYVISDLGLPLNGSINRASPSWDTALYTQFTSTIDNLNQYPNLLAVNIGNEVPMTDFYGDQAIVRDIKAYIKSINSNVLVGYAAVDKNAGANGFRDRLSSLLTCDTEETSLDIYGLNTYRWCGDKTYNNSGYDSITEGLLNKSFPEIGCATDPPRLWTETQAVTSNPMAEIFSGFVAFEYFADDVDEGQDFCTHALTNPDGAITTTDDFDRLATQIATGTVANPPSVAESSATNLPLQACPTKNENWIASNEIPPSPDLSISACLVENTFSPSTNPIIVGELIDYVCQQQGVTCADIAGNATTGVYGKVSWLSPQDKLSYLFTQYYEGQKRAADACDFSGNATAVASISSPVTAAQESCLAKTSTAGGSNSSSSSGSNARSNNDDSAASSIFSVFTTLPAMLFTLALLFF
ncbi:carbohydrate-binding module family 43 protein, partial [Atractiella rhizophila]